MVCTKTSEFQQMCSKRPEYTGECQFCPFLTHSLFLCLVTVFWLAEVSLFSHISSTIPACLVVMFLQVSISNTPSPPSLYFSRPLLFSLLSTQYNNSFLTVSHSGCCFFPFPLHDFCEYRISSFIRQAK